MHVLVSIHAPVKGATIIPHNFSGIGPGFNPRAREGRDADITETADDVQVSIHAPVKGATPCLLPCLDAYFVSIHAPVKGATPAGT